MSRINLSAPPGALTRRAIVLGAPLFLAACNTTARSGADLKSALPDPQTSYASMYAAVPDEKFPLPAVDTTRIPQAFLRQEVRYGMPHPVGSIVVDPYSHYLYLVLEGDCALRYGIGVGRDGFAWSGTAVVQYKRAWPKWTPPAEMILRQPELEQWRHGMPPGLSNPLGARALYLFQDGRDTLYRIHGTNEPHSIGKSVSSGCIRLLNQDIIDLFNRVPDGSQVVVLPAPGAAV